MSRLCLLALLTLAACGVDGAPQPPADGMTLSGTATLGVARDGG